MRKKTLMVSLAVVSAVGGVAVAGGRWAFDFGSFRDKALDARANALFGIYGGLEKSSKESIERRRPKRIRALVKLAQGLRAHVVSASTELGANIDMMALWPDDYHPTHIIACNEQGHGEPACSASASPTARSRQSSRDASCDPVQRTPWGTIVVGEESGPDGQVIEIIDPLRHHRRHFDRVAGTFSGGTGAENLAVRRALGRLSFEGVGLYPNGVMYYGDEKRPGNGTPGGAYYKFVPATPWAGGAPIHDLAQSPLAAGQVYGLRLGLRAGGTDYGQGTQTGQGVWVPIPGADNANLRAQAAALKLTGYYRPEDIDIDAGALAAGNVRFCGNNTGNESNDQLLRRDHLRDRWHARRGDGEHGHARGAAPGRRQPRARDDGQHRPTSRAAATGSSTRTATGPRSAATTTCGRASRTARTTMRCRTAASASPR